MAAKSATFTVLLTCSFYKYSETSQQEQEQEQQQQEQQQQQQQQQFTTYTVDRDASGKKGTNNYTPYSTNKMR